MTLKAWRLQTSLLITDCTSPFTVGIVTDANSIADTTDSGTAANAAPDVGRRGVCLEYTQVPCT